MLYDSFGLALAIGTVSALIIVSNEILFVMCRCVIIRNNSMISIQYLEIPNLGIYSPFRV